MQFIRQTIRGIRNLPYVGSHPGTPMLGILVGLGALAGFLRGDFEWIRVLGGALGMLVFFLPMYLYGAYSRANISDRAVKKEFKMGCPINK